MQQLIAWIAEREAIRVRRVWPEGYSCLHDFAIAAIAAARVGSYPYTDWRTAKCGAVPPRLPGCWDCVIFKP
jgi:hypothetical protein